MKLINFTVGPDKPLFLIAGPCVVESEGLVLDTAGKLKELTARLGIPFIFKSWFDKANRSSQKSYRGPGMEEGLRILSEVKRQLGLPVLTPEAPEERAGNTVFATDRSLEVERALRENGVLVWAGDGRVRLSVHAFNDETDVARALAVLEDLTARGAV